MNFALFIGPWQVLLILSVAFLWIIPAVLALIDIARNEFTGNNKVIWILIVAFGSFIGPLLYFAVGRSQKLPKP
jgi:hypothetical protein